MNTDIRIAIDFFDHPKTVKLMRRCGVEGIIALQRLWIWAALHKPDGNLSNMDIEDIEIAAKWEGDQNLFFNSIKDKFIDKNNETYALHDWCEHNPWAAGFEIRSNIGRFNRMKRTYPEIYGFYVKAQIKSISKKDYNYITSSENPLEAAYDLLKQYLSKKNERSSSPSTPSPAPAPAPAPTPKQGTAVAATPQNELTKENKQQQQQLRTIIFLNRKNLVRICTGVDEENFEAVAEHCIAYYKTNSIGVNPYETVIAWFKRERKQQPIKQKNHDLESLDNLLREATRNEHEFEFGRMDQNDRLGRSFSTDNDQTVAAIEFIKNPGL